MTRADLEAAGFRIARASMTRRKDPTALTNRALNVLLLKKGREHYLTWSFDFPSQQFTEPQLVTREMIEAAGGAV